MKTIGSDIDALLVLTANSPATVRPRQTGVTTNAYSPVNETRRRAAAHQASRRMIARGDRPAYRITTAQDGRWCVDAVPWVSVTATGRREALDEARAAIAEWLGVPSEAFDVDG